MAQTGKLTVVACTLGLLCQLTLGQNITAATCASPGSFLNCMGTVEAFLSDCVASNQPCDTDCLLSCSCGAQVGQVGCALENCWNVVYGCEYQSIAAELVTYCFDHEKDIPFFPAPDHAPGGCSCNLGYIAGNLTNVNTAATSCAAASTGNLARTGACLCCLEAGDLTSIYSICPDTSLSYLEQLFTAGTLANVEFGFDNCPPSFSQFDCVSDLDYPPIGAFSYLTTIPTTSGSLMPSTTGPSLTSPVSSLIIYTLGTSTGTITPVSAPKPQPTSTAAGNSKPTGSAPRVASMSSGFFNIRLLALCTVLFCYWI